MMRLERTATSAPETRTVCQLTGEVADRPSANITELAPANSTDEFLTALRQANEQLARLAKFQEDVENAKAEIDELTLLLAASGAHVATLSTAVHMYQKERDEARDQIDEYRYGHERYERAEDELIELRAGLEELRTEIAQLKGGAK